jgi:hypothetical protein
MTAVASRFNGFLVRFLRDSTLPSYETVETVQERASRVNPSIRRWTNEIDERQCNGFRAFELSEVIDPEGRKL